MNKLLATLWVIILGGGTFIAISLFRPDAQEDLNAPEISSTNNTESKTEFKEGYTEYLRLGDENFKNQDYDKALQNYLSASKINSNSADPFYKLGETYIKLNKPDSALEYYKKALKINSSSNTIKLGITKAFLAKRQFEEAKKIVFALDQENPEVKYYKGILLILYKDFDNAKKLFEETSDKKESENFLSAYKLFSYFKGGSQLHLQTLLAKAMVQNEFYEASIPLLFDVINSKKNYRDAWIILGYSYLKVDKLNDAIDAFNQAKALDTSKPEPYFYLGLAYFNSNELEEAANHLKEALEKGYKPAAEVNKKLGDIYIIQNQFEDAANEYEDVLSLNNQEMSSYVKLTWLYIDKLNNPQKALIVGKKALENFPDDAMSYNLIGWTLTAGKKYKEAEKYLAKAIELNPNLDAANLNLGLLYEKQGYKKLATEYYTKAYLLGKGGTIGNTAREKLNNINIQANTTSP